MCGGENLLFSLPLHSMISVQWQDMRGWLMDCVSVRYRTVSIVLVLTCMLYCTVVNCFKFRQWIERKFFTHKAGLVGEKISTSGTRPILETIKQLKQVSILGIKRHTWLILNYFWRGFFRTNLESILVPYTDKISLRQSTRILATQSQAKTIYPCDIVALMWISTKEID